MIERLIHYYKASLNGYSDSSLSLIWKVVSNSSQKFLAESLSDGNVDSVVNALESKGTVYGLELGEITPELIEKYAIRAGCTQMFNPEQDSQSSDVIVSEERTGYALYNLSRTSIPGFNPCKLDRKDTSNSMLVVSASCCITLNLLLDRFPHTILEIGSGACSYPYIARLFGCKSYSSIDIPTTSVIGAYLLSKKIGEDKIWLYGEPENMMAFARFYPSSAFRESIRPYDCVFQCNGFPEFSIETQNEYLEYIHMVLMDDGVLHSVNHESKNTEQRSVSESMREFRKFRLRYRAPFMLRNGYIEEVFSLA